MTPSWTSGWQDGSAATVMPHTGSIAVGGLLRRWCVAGRAGGSQAPCGTQLDQLGQDRDRDLAVRGVPQVEPDGHVHPVEESAWNAALLEVAEHGFATAPRGDQADEGRGRPHRLLDRLLVAAPLHRDDDKGAGVDAEGGELPGVEDLAAPAESRGQVPERVGHR